MRHAGATVGPSMSRRFLLGGAVRPARAVGVFQPAGRAVGGGEEVDRVALARLHGGIAAALDVLAARLLETPEITSAPLDELFDDDTDSTRAFVAPGSLASAPTLRDRRAPVAGGIGPEGPDQHP